MLKVQWYPGHMAKAKRKLIEQIDIIDIVIELRDARIPNSSYNEDIDKLLKNKYKLIILTKKDLANSMETAKWIEYLNINNRAISTCGTNINDVKKIVKELIHSKDEIFAKRRKKGLLNRSLRVMVVGVSNVGKSSLINSMAKRRATNIGDKPGVTKGNQWINIDQGIELLDTPGILWPKFSGENIGFNLAVTGAVSEIVFNIEECALILIEKLKLNIDETPYMYLEKYTRNRGLLEKGGFLDIEKGSLLFLKDFKKGKLGRYTLEKAEEFNGIK